MSGGYPEISGSTTYLFVFSLKAPNSPAMYKKSPFFSFPDVNYLIFYMYKCMKTVCLLMKKKFESFQLRNFGSLDQGILK